MTVQETYQIHPTQDPLPEGDALLAYMLAAGVYEGVSGKAEKIAHERLGISQIGGTAIAATPERVAMRLQNGQATYVAAFVGGLLAAHNYDTGILSNLDPAAIDLLYEGGVDVSPDEVAYLVGSAAATSDLAIA